MKYYLQKYPIFLVSLPLFLVIHIWKDYHPLIYFNVVFLESAILVILPLILLAIFWLITRSSRKAALLALLFAIPFYFLGEIKDWLIQLLDKHFFSSYRFLLTVSVILVLVCAWMILKTKSDFRRFFLFINTLLLILIVLDLGTFGYRVFIRDVKKDFPIASNYQTCSSCEKPDIYFLVFDSYTSSRLLKDEFNYDNGALDSMLTERGFRIIRESKSNYNLTPFSIGSSFNLEYLHTADTSKIYRLRSYLPAVLRVYDNALIQILEKEGYNIDNHSLFDLRDHPSTVPGFDVWGTKQLFEQHNLYKKLSKDIGWHFSFWRSLGPKNKLKDYANNRDRHDSIAINQIMNSARKNGSAPKFVYGHLFLPHSPYTYDSNGNKLEPIAVMSPEDDKKAYVQQIVYTNRIIRELLDSIMSNRTRPIAIIIQGDHGYRFFEPAKNKLEFPNLNAVYLSSGAYKALNDTMTNVQTFRFLLNMAFGKNYPYLEDHFYFLHYK